MNRLFPSLLAGWLGGAALALLLTTPAAAGEAPDRTGPDIGQQQLGFPQPVKPSDYWLGIGLSPLIDALRAQLEIPEGQGLLVRQVAPEAPGARADVRRHDIVLKVDGKPLAGIQELIDAVDAAKDREVSLEIIRAGKPMTIKLKPEKRPQETILPDERPVPGQPELGSLLERLERVSPGWKKTPLRARILTPGVILPPGAPVHAALPGNLWVTIRKHGDEPAKIDVRRNGESWSVDENGLDKLPPDISMHVQRMLGGVTIKSSRRGDAVIVGRGDGFIYEFEGRPVRESIGEGWLEKRLEEMNRRIERLQEMMEGLRDRGPKDKGSEKKSSEKKTPKVKQEQA